MGTKYDVDKFIGDKDFRLRKVKTQAILIQQKCAEALKGEADLSDRIHVTP